MHRTFLTALLAGGALACAAHSGWMPTNPPPRPLEAHSPDDVALFTATMPTRAFVEVGIISAAPGMDSNDFEVLAQLRKEGGARGCDGLIVIGTNTNTTGSSNAYGITMREQTSFRAACIVYP
jgi:hypothetical protein